LSLRQSLALWTLVPMAAFSLIVLILSFAWAWRDVFDIASQRDANLVWMAASALAERATGEPQEDGAPCAVLRDLSTQVQGSMYIVQRDGQILCASGQARLPVGASLDHADVLYPHLTPFLEQESQPGSPTIAASTLPMPRYILSYAPIAGTPWVVLLEEQRANIIAPTYSFVIALSALMIVGLAMAFWLLLIGFQRISWPLLAVTEQAVRVAAGQDFVPPDVTGPAEVEALVAAFNHMVTLLRKQRDTLHEYAVRMLNSQEEERKRLSRDLHDETAQELVGLMQRIDLCRLAAVDRGHPQDNPELMANLDELAELTERTLAGVRRMSQALRPLILEDLGLVAAVQAIADELEQDLSKARVFCEVIGAEQRLEPEAELTAFRIVQEALTNVRKHATDADRVYVTIQFEPDALQIDVEDNGQGFYLPERKPETNGESLGAHLGLLGMRERAELLDGTLTILTRPGQGTRVDLVLPRRNTPRNS
jgi:signal transduction histidine kinase